jgi:N-acetyl sugar amidotransferase
MQSPDVDWEQRWDMLKELTDSYRSKSSYDIVIPVSGGKDSYFQTHIAVKKLGLKALLVTYHGNNYLPEGEYNLFRMREVFNCDHIIVRPSVDVLIKMNRLGFKVQGDMNWHAHCGIFSTPIDVAVKYNAPLMMWGEHGFMDLGGMHSYNDFVEFTAKYRKEHALRGYDWNDFTDEGLETLGHAECKEGLSEKDLLWAKYPSDDDIYDVGVRGIYLSNYVDWDGEQNAKLMSDLYGWKGSDQKFERTYRMSSNLDDMHENGIHDYLKFIKFGYGRATDHVCKDIRAGRMSREDGINEVRNRDHIKPNDLSRWLSYVDMSEKEFDEICDTFRDSRVWWIQDGLWWKENVWGGYSSYGPVCLSKDAQKNYQR